MHIEDISTAATDLRLKNTSTGGRSWVVSSLGQSHYFGAAKFNIFDETANASRLLIDASGNVGIGTTSPAGALHVTSGQVIGAYVAANSSTINWNQANVQSTNVNAGTLTFTTGSLVNGANYTLVISNATGGAYTLASADITTWKCIPVCTSNQVQVIGGKDTLLTLLKVGTTGYVSWTQGF